MPRIFLSYRRSDSQDVAGRIFDRLSAHFSKENVFKDVDSIPLGIDFQRFLERAIEKADVLLVLIGPTWFTTTNAQGQRRLDDANDFVRAEVEIALRLGKRIIPITVGNAPWFNADELPECLKALALQNGLAVRPDPDFHRDMGRLISAIETSPDGAQPDVFDQASSKTAERESLQLWLVLLPHGEEGFRTDTTTNSNIEIGMHRDCQIVLQGHTISRRHARLVQEGDGYRCTDTTSACGTFVNGERINSAMIRNGDVVRFGDLRCLAIIGQSDSDFGLPRSDTAKILLRRASRRLLFEAADVFDTRVYATAVALYDDYEYRIARVKFALAIHLARILDLSAHDRCVLAYAVLLARLGISQMPLEERGHAGARMTSEQVACIRANTLELLEPLKSKQPFGSVIELLEFCFNSQYGGSVLACAARIVGTLAYLMVDRPYIKSHPPEKAWEMVKSSLKDDPVLNVLNAVPDDSWVKTIESAKTASFPEMSGGISWTDIELQESDFELDENGIQFL